MVTAATGSSTLYKLADLVSVYKVLPAAYRPSATWLISADDFASLAGTGGHVGPRAHARCDGRPLLADAARILAHSASWVPCAAGFISRSPLRSDGWGVPAAPRPGSGGWGC